MDYKNKFDWIFLDGKILSPIEGNEIYFLRLKDKYKTYFLCFVSELLYKKNDLFIDKFSLIQSQKDEQIINEIENLSSFFLYKILDEEFFFSLIENNYKICGLEFNKQEEINKLNLLENRAIKLMKDLKWF